MNNYFIIIQLIFYCCVLSSCSSVKLDDVDSEEQFELESLNKDEHQISDDYQYNYQKGIKFVEYSIDECKCRILIPDNHTIKKITHNNGSVSYVGLVDMGMYALTCKRMDSNSGTIELDSFFAKEVEKLQMFEYKTVLHSDFVLNGFNMKEMTTLVDSEFNKTYSVQRVTFDDNILYKIEFFGIINNDINYLSANRFLNSLQRQYQLEI